MPTEAVSPAIKRHLAPVAIALVLGAWLVPGAPSLRIPTLLTMHQDVAAFGVGRSGSGVVHLERLMRLRRVASARRQVRSLERLGGLTAESLSVPVQVLADEVDLPGGANRQEVIGGLTLLSDIHLRNMDLEAADIVLGKAVAVSRAPDGDAASFASRDLVSEVYVRRGNVRRLQGRYADAEVDLEAALTAASSPITRGGADNARGILAKDMGHFDEAARRYGRALELLQGELGEGSPALAALMHNLAGLAHARGRYVDGEVHIRRALELRGRGQGDGAEALGDRVVLAALLTGQERLEEAEALLADAVTDWIRIRGADHYEVGHARHHLGVVMAKRGRPDNAAAELSVALAILRRVLGNGHPEVEGVERDLTAVGEGRSL